MPIRWCAAAAASQVICSLSAPIMFYFWKQTFQTIQSMWKGRCHCSKCTAVLKERKKGMALTRKKKVLKLKISEERNWMLMRHTEWFHVQSYHSRRRKQRAAFLLNKTDRDRQSFGRHAEDCWRQSATSFSVRWQHPIRRSDSTRPRW